MDSNSENTRNPRHKVITDGISVSERLLVVTVGLQGLVEKAILLYRQDVDWALRLGLIVWALSAVNAAAWASWWPRLMWIVAVVILYVTLTSDLFPINRGPLTWLVHFLVASGVGAGSAGGKEASGTDEATAAAGVVQRGAA